MTLPPIPFSPVSFIPTGEAMELTPADWGWRCWDTAVAAMDETMTMEVSRAAVSRDESDRPDVALVAL